MSKKNRSDSTPVTDTLQLRDEYEAAAEDVSAAEAEETVEPIAEAGEQYAKAEKALNVITTVLSVLLVGGSLVFWWYFSTRLSVCPLVINNYQLYQVMLIGCAAIPLAATVLQAVFRRPVNAEGWMVNMCASGVLTAIVATICNVSAFGNSFAWNDFLTTLCFSVSGCALPAAIYALIRWLVVRLTDWVRRTAAIDREIVYADVLAQCEGRF